MSYTVGRGTDSPQPAVERPGEKLSLGVAARLSRYLQVLIQARKIGKDTISSQELAEYTHVNSTQIRRDLSGFGKFGKRGVGYNIESLVTQIRKILRTSGQHNIALFGAGHLGTAIATSDIFADHGFRVVAIFDIDQARVGMKIGPLAVRHNSDLRSVVDEQDIVVAVLAVPSSAAQGLADELGVSRVTLFRRVGSREELISQALWRLTERMLEIAVERWEAERPEGELHSPGTIRHINAMVAGSTGLRRLLDEEPALPLRVLTDPRGLQDRCLAESGISAQRYGVNAIGADPFDQFFFSQSLSRSQREVPSGRIARAQAANKMSRRNQTEFFRLHRRKTF